MTTKTTKAGRDYEIEDGKRLIWHAEVWEDEGETPFDVTIPLRFKVGALRPLKGMDMNDPGVMIDMLEKIIPNQSDQLDNLDVNDLMEMFETWFEEYNALNGASLGEASRSSS